MSVLDWKDAPPGTVTLIQVGETDLTYCVAADGTTTVLDGAGNDVGPVNDAAVKAAPDAAAALAAVEALIKQDTANRLSS